MGNRHQRPMVAFFVLAGFCGVMLTIGMVRGTAAPDFFHPAQALEAPRLESGPGGPRAAAPAQAERPAEVLEAGAAGAAASLPAAPPIGLAVFGTLVEKAVEASTDDDVHATTGDDGDRENAAKAQRKADREAARTQRKADRDEARAQRKAERDAAKASRGKGRG